jgi:hypothetical protein
VRTAYIVEERANPSTERYVLPALAEEDVHVVRSGFNAVPEPQALNGADIIFVRYLPPAWIRTISGGKTRPHRLAIFIDDDLFDLTAWGATPWRYRWKLLRLARLRRNWLRQHGAELWVGSAQLREKYAAWHPRLLEPRPLQETPPLTRIFYHGSASHAREHAWICALMRPVLEENQNLCFEVIADRRSAGCYRRLPRTWVVAPMPWQSYRAFLSSPGRHIGLAPMLPGAFNAARSHTRFFDITEAGAVGIYARGSVYDRVVEDARNGLLLPMDPGPWSTAIVALSQDHGRIMQMNEQAAATAIALAQGPLQSPPSGREPESC